MLVRDEFKCRRCGTVFGEPRETVEECLAGVGQELLDLICGEGASTVNWHGCHFGGIGIGDWIGASEVKQAEATKGAGD